MTDAPEPNAVAPSPPAVAQGGGLVEWALRTRAIAHARADAAAGSPRRAELYRRARLALELADRTHDAVDPLKHGSGAALAIGLYREAVYWALASLEGVAVQPEKRGDDGGTPPDFESLWKGADEDLIEALPGSTERVRELFLTRTFVDHADENEAVQATDAAVLRAFAHAIAVRAGGPYAGLDRLRRERLVRSAMVAIGAFFGVLVLVLAVSAILRKPDLARGKPWRASSSWGDCQPAKRTCGGITDTAIFFHTNEDPSPWVEIDLGVPTTFSSITVKNRSDCCTDRAVPLVVETSDDQKSWVEIARKKDDFTTWSASFAPKQARYVRVRVDRKTWLHLEKVIIQ